MSVVQLMEKGKVGDEVAVTAVLPSLLGDTVARLSEVRTDRTEASVSFMSGGILVKRATFRKENEGWMEC